MTGLYWCTRMSSSRFVILAAAALLGSLSGPLTAATFGTVVPQTGAAADIILDEPRGRVYLVNTNRNEIDIYSISQKRFLSPVSTDSTPLAAAMTRDGRYLYVTCNAAASLNVVDLNSGTRTGRVALPEKPEGIAFGNDNRALVSTSGSGNGNAQNVLLIYNPADGSINNVPITPAPPLSPVLPATSGRPTLAIRSQLRATPDGRLIIGVNMVSNTAQSVWVYEAASGTVLRSRRVTNISAVLAVAPDGSRFMAGLTLFDTASLTVLAQQNLANATYEIPTNSNFNTQANQGGSIFTPDGSALYSAFNITPQTNPPTRANVSQLMISDPDNLLINMALQLPENLIGKMEITADGGTIYALSESGFAIVPMNQLSSNPIAVSNPPLVLLSYDQCGVLTAQNTAQIQVTNAGKGRLTATASLIQANTGPGGLGGGGGGIIIVLPGIGGITIGGGGPTTSTSNTATAPSVRTSNTAAGANFDFVFNNSLKTSIGTISPYHEFLIQSPEAVNIPARVRILQNSRNSEARGTLVPIEVGISTTYALQDLLLDSARQRVYIANAGRNRIEVYDIRKQTLLSPVKVCQLPQSMAVTPDGGTMYVACTGGENIAIVDLNSLKQVGRVTFPATPFDASVTLVTPTAIAATERGAMFLMSNGTLWSIVGGKALPRRPSSIIGITAAGAQTSLTTPYNLAATPAGEYVLVTSGNGYVYLYDSLVDDFVQGRQIQTAPIRGYRGPVTAGPKGAYFVVNGIVLNSALAPVADAPSVITPGNNGQTTTTPVPIAAVAQINPTTFARFSQPVRAAANAATTTPPTIDIIDATTGATRSSIPALEGPVAQVASATASTNIAGRTMAIDATGTFAYAISTTGLSIIPLDLVPASARPVLNNRATVNLGSGLNTIAPNNLVAITGRNLAADATAPTSGNLPTTLGGACVTLGNNVLPLIATSSGQINAQIPPSIATGNYQMTVRNLDQHVASATQAVTISKYAPAVLTDANGRAQVYRVSDNRQITTDNPANRDEPLVMYAVGLGVPKAALANVASGVPVPATPAIATDAVQVFFGNPSIKEAGIIVDGSHFAPGMIGVYEIRLRVPGAHISGNALPITIKIGTTSSPNSAKGPTIAVN